MFSAIVADVARTHQICGDVDEALRDGRRCLLLSRMHSKRLPAYSTVGFEVPQKQDWLKAPADSEVRF